jgi:hypothetical protein
MDMMPSDDHKIVIRSDKTPVGQHARRFNAHTIDEVAIVVVGKIWSHMILFYIIEIINYNVLRKHIAHMMYCNILLYFDKVKMAMVSQSR